MVSIARICEKLIEKKPFLQEALVSGIINYGALADSMIKDVDVEYGKKVKHAAVMMALRRLSEKLENMPISRPRFTSDCDLTIKSDLFEMTFVRHPGTYKLVNKFYDLVDPRHGDFFTVTTGMHEITIICNKKYKKNFLKLLKKEDILIIVDDLAALTVKLPKKAVEVPGIFYLITRALTWENINIVEVVSTYTEDTILLRNKDVSRAYEILLRTIKENC
ncbi:hypothetical protein COV16_01320 [Candidatus Woesearchaeota archaeon CG10_big_fil_rev_8_21_14_0_10_34_8]|nr:MAG: hypothetical protein COV16_01320 [Candidatus Woesearchaeota archaeon CG10_big_fil_rev_8_21_14_0_10_34_8]